MPRNLTRGEFKALLLSFFGILLTIAGYGQDPVYLATWFGIGLTLYGSADMPTARRWFVWTVVVMAPPIYYWTYSPGRPDPLRTAAGITVMCIPMLAILWAHSKLRKQIDSPWTQLFLPACWTSYDYIFEVYFGSFTSFAYTQQKASWILQICAVTGYTGITFLLLWSATWLRCPSFS
ncbi:MAG: hypothetical protein IPJ84_03155 [Bdellovibrionales bacterium]|nr:hypothetical protein [Bdellovibrionales bacterium]